MKKTPLRRVSAKKAKVLRHESILQKKLLEQCQGRCMICGQRKPLERNHNRKRDRFILSCRECHNPNGVHRYLDDVEVKYDKMV